MIREMQSEQELSHSLKINLSKNLRLLTFAQFE
jgi:hypothetical protein